MNQRDLSRITIENWPKSLGIRDDIAYLLLFLFAFLIALIICVIIAKKNHLFHFSHKDTYKNLNEQELMQ